MDGSRTQTSVRLAEGVRAELVRRWQEAGGREPCGVLLGHGEEGGVFDVHALVVLTNQHPQPDRGWQLAPEDVLAARHEARRAGRAVIGFWHGHLRGPAEPSKADYRERSVVGPDLHLIVARGSEDVPTVRAWWATAEGFVPVSIDD